MYHKRLWLPLILLALAALACALPGGGESDGALFKDNFERDSSGWGSDTDADGSRGYENGEYVFRIGEGGWTFWAVPEESFSNVHIEVTAKNTGDAEDPGFGIICNYQDGENFYFLGIGSDQLYAIAKFVNDDLTILTDSEGFWTLSDAIPAAADSYRIGADCGNGQLTLYVNGTEIASVEDADYADGDVGLFTQSAEQPEVEVRFDDFVVTKLGE